MNARPPARSPYPPTSRRRTKAADDGTTTRRQTTTDKQNRDATNEVETQTMPVPQRTRRQERKPRPEGRDRDTGRPPAQMPQPTNVPGSPELQPTNKTEKGRESGETATAGNTVVLHRRPARRTTTRRLSPRNERIGKPTATRPETNNRPRAGNLRGTRCERMRARAPIRCDTRHTEATDGRGGGREEVDQSEHSQMTHSPTRRPDAAEAADKK